MRRSTGTVAAVVAVVVVVLVAVLVLVLTRGSDDSPGAAAGPTSGTTGSAGTADPTVPESGSTGSSDGAAPDDPNDPADPAYDVAVSTPREDSVYPAHGDPGIDTLHYGLDLTWDRDTRTLTGRADIALRAVTTADRFQLDLRRDFTVSAVTVDGRPVSYRLGQDDHLVVRSPVTADQRYDVVVEYAGRPRRMWSPTTRVDTPFVGLQISDDGMVWTMQEPYGAATWYPVNDQPSDKALYDVTVRTPADWVGIANGELTSRETTGDQTVTTWHLDRPAASYLTTLAMGDYVEHTARTASGVPLSYWTKAGDTRALEKLQVTPDVMAWNEQHLGPYPFDSLGLVVVRSDSAMETQTMVTLGDTDYSLSAPVIQHETAHQWYGDMVTPSDWRDVWMNEGMVMFLQLAYQADRDGTTVDRELDENRAYEAAQRFEGGPPGDYKPGQFGLGNIYYGPALMWNDLRHRIGDDRFWALVRKWPTVHPYGNATRAQYVRWLEQETGLRLRPFIDAWLMDENTPKGLRIP